MTTPLKALLAQARDALMRQPFKNWRTDKAIAALTAAIDAPEPYDQQALEPCPVCGWKAIVPGEPCLMCERNARMLAPEPEPDSEPVAEVMLSEGEKIIDASMAFFDKSPVGTKLYLHPPAVREPITQERAEALAHRRCKRYVFIDDVPYQFDAKTLMDFVRGIEGAKP